jgi:hypothetical protein
VTAEIERSGIEWQAGRGGPQIELIAGSLAVKAVEEMTRDVNREMAFRFSRG